MKLFVLFIFLALPAFAASDFEIEQTTDANLVCSEMSNFWNTPQLVPDCKKVIAGGKFEPHALTLCRHLAYSFNEPDQAIDCLQVINGVQFQMNDLKGCFKETFFLGGKPYLAVPCLTKAAKTPYP